MTSRSVILNFDELLDMLKKAAQTGIDCADTVDDYTISGIAYEILREYFKELEP